MVSALVEFAFPVGELDINHVITKILHYMNEKSYRGKVQGAMRMYNKGPDRLGVMDIFPAELIFDLRSAN